MRSELAMKTRQALTENTIKHTKHIRARRNSSEGLPNDMREISAARLVMYTGSYTIREAVEKLSYSIISYLGPIE